MDIQQKLKHLQTTKRSYIAKLRELKTFGSENRNGHRINETKTSIKVVINEIKRLRKL